MPQLITIAGADAGRCFPLRAKHAYLSLSAHGRLQLRADPPPRHGLVIEANRNGTWRVARLDARPNEQPLFVNGHEVESAEITNGDLISFGGNTLSFESHTESNNETPPEHPSAGKRLSQSSVVGRAPVGDGLQAIASLRKQPESPESNRIETLLRIALELASSLELAPMLERLLDRLFELVPAERGTILLLDRPTKSLRAMVGKRRGEPATEGSQHPVSRTIVREAVKRREAILTVDALADRRFQSGQSVVSEGIRSALCLPVARRGRVLAVIYLDCRQHTRAFSRADLETAAAVAGLASVAIDNAILFHHTAERERLRTELQLANGIQARLLPREPVRDAGFEVAGNMVPARELGGDIFDLVRTSDGAVHIVVGDVSGKGAGAALVMAMARSYLRPFMRSDASPRKALNEVNRWLFADTEARIFMSCVYALYRPETGTLRWCGAGQEYVLIYRAQTGTVEAQPAGGMALALVDDVQEHLEEREVELRPGDALLFYTDGVTDARNASGQMYGRKRLEALFARAVLTAQTAGGDVEVALDAIVSALRTWMGDADPHDDITVVLLLRRRETGESPLC